MEILIKLNDGAICPSNAHASDTGYDVTAIGEPTIVGEQEGEDLWRSISYLEYDTGISVAPEFQPWRLESGTQFDERYGFLRAYPRSSISKTNLVLANSVPIIDHSFRGTIKLRFRYLLQPCDMVISETYQRIHIEREKRTNIYQRVDPTSIYHAGDKIAQLEAAWKEDIQWKVVQSLDETARGQGGFGSSDRPSGWKS